MIENQSDNIDNKENDVSNQDNAPEDIIIYARIQLLKMMNYLLKKQKK